MSKIGFALAAASLAFSVSANAADLPSRKAPLPALTAPAFTWTGFYVGVHAGLREQAGSLSLSPFGDSPADAAVDPNLSGGSLSAGALAGYNYQIGSTVLGVEGDIGFGSKKKTVISDKASVSTSIWYAANDLKQTVDGHVRARLGWASGPLLLFGAAGVALTNAKLNVVGYCPPDIYTGEASKNLVGLSLGAGGEYALTSNIVARAEYLFDDYGHKSLSPSVDQIEGNWQDRKLHLQTHTIRAALSYKF